MPEGHGSRETRREARAKIFIRHLLREGLECLDQRRPPGDRGAPRMGVRQEPEDGLGRRAQTASQKTKKEGRNLYQICGCACTPTSLGTFSSCTKKIDERVCDNALVLCIRCCNHYEDAMNRTADYRAFCVNLLDQVPGISVLDWMLVTSEPATLGGLRRPFSAGACCLCGW